MPSKTCRKITYAIAIKEAIDQCMEKDSNVVIIGEGVPDPKAIFGTTSGLESKYGKSRVFDMPLSENGVTGICIGAAISGLRPVLVHQRIDFALLSLDQLINNAAKWYFMFNKTSSVPIVVRMIIGRGWGQGPQHSQGLQAIFAQIPGLKVVMPTTPFDAKGMLISAIEDNNPVLFIEHRWLHYIEDVVPEYIYRVDLDKARVIQEGSRLTIAAFSYLVIECLSVVKSIQKHIELDIEIIDMRSISHLDVDLVLNSVMKTGHLIVADCAGKFGSVAGELISSVVERGMAFLKAPPIRLGSLNYPAPTSHFLIDSYYVTPINILDAVYDVLNINRKNIKYIKIRESLSQKDYHDVPNKHYQGPF